MLKERLLKFLKLDSLIENLTGYVETRVELLKVEVREDLIKALAKFSIFFVLGFSFIVFILFSSIALAFWIGEYLSPVGGFAIVGLLYLLLAVVLFLLKEGISKRVEKKLLEIVKKK